jgi:hypothetical protein
MMLFASGVGAMPSPGAASDSVSDIAGRATPTAN